MPVQNLHTEDTVSAKFTNNILYLIYFLLSIDSLQLNNDNFMSMFRQLKERLVLLTCSLFNKKIYP